MKYDNLEQLRQALMELHYDLLEPEEEADLRAAIDSDPEVAVEWQRTLNLADQIADAARIESLDTPSFSSPLDSVGQSSDPSKGRDAAKNSRMNASALPPFRESSQANDNARSKAPSLEPVRELEDAPGDSMPNRGWGWSWATSASIACVAAMLGLLLIGSWYFARLPDSPVAVIRLQARHVPEHLAESENEYRLFTSRMDQSSSTRGYPVTPANLSFTVLARETALFSGTVRTDDEGSGRITLPEDLVIPPDAKLKVTAQSASGDAVASYIEVPLAPTRYATYLTVDRPVYRPGETIYFRSLTLKRWSRQPGTDLPVRFELLGPDRGVIEGCMLEGVADVGVGNGEFVIPSDAEVGDYSLVVRSLDGMFPDETYDLQVRGFRTPKFHQSLQFSQPSYRESEMVRASLSATRSTGEPLVGANVNARVMIGDDLTSTIEAAPITEEPGSYRIEFTLPDDIERAEVSLNVSVTFQGEQETRLFPVPLHFGEVAIDFYPEGGYLVSGLRNRVYFSARDESGVGVTIRGQLINGEGAVIAEVKSTRDGMGQFDLRPNQAESYRLRVTDPEGVSSTRQIPASVSDLPVINTGAGVFAAGDPITFRLESDRDRSVLIRANCRGRMVGQQRVRIGPGTSRVTMPVINDVDGVVRLTVLDADATPLRPLIERLVFCRPAGGLQIEAMDVSAPIRTEPGQSVDVTVVARDDLGQPVRAILGVSVVDEAVQSLGSEHRPSLQTQFVLLSEIRDPQDLENADFYLRESAEAEQGLDLLLGTQGWRRFSDQDTPQAIAGLRDQLVRLLQLDGEPPEQSKSFDNSSLFASDWFQYRQGIRTANERLVVELKILTFLVVFIWFVAFLMHRWRRARVGLAASGMLLLCFGLLEGCGVSPEAMVVESQTSEAESESSAESEAPRATRPDAFRDESPANDEPLAGKVDDPVAPDELPADLVDWLDQDRVAWLLRLSQGETDTNINGRRRIKRDDLVRLMRERGINAEQLADDLINQLQFPIREYAHQHNPASDPASDLTETLFWNPLMTTDAQGRARIRFDLSDAETTFQMRIDGHTKDGQVTTWTQQIVSESAD